MHEMSITNALVEQVEAVLPAGARLTEVRLEVGVLEHLDAEIMELAWQAITDEKEEMQGAALKIKRVSLRIRCRNCGNEYEPPDIYGMICPECDSASPQVLQGSGVLLRGISAEQPDTAEKELRDGH